MRPGTGPATPNSPPVLAPRGPTIRAWHLCTHCTSNTGMGPPCITGAHCGCPLVPLPQRTRIHTRTPARAPPPPPPTTTHTQDVSPASTWQPEHPTRWIHPHRSSHHLSGNHQEGRAGLITCPQQTTSMHCIRSHPWHPRSEADWPLTQFDHPAPSHTIVQLGYQLLR